MKQSGILYLGKSIVTFFVEHILFVLLFTTLFSLTALMRAFYIIYQQCMSVITGKKYQAQYHPIKN